MKVQYIDKQGNDKIQAPKSEQSQSLITNHQSLYNQMELRVINTHEDKTNEMYASSDCQQLINSMNDYYPEIGFNLPWVGYFAIKNNQVVGTGSFTGQPKDGCVEIAYWTFKAFEGQGIASYVCKELVAISKSTDPTLIITAKTAPEYNASTKILQKNGFEFSKIVQDHEIGDAWLWTFRGCPKSFPLKINDLRF